MTPRPTPRSCSDAICWRNAHPHTTRFWDEIDRAAKIAVRRPGTVVPCRSIAFRYGRDGFLRLRLPNGRRLTYPFARVKTLETAYGETVVTFMDIRRRPVE